MTPKFRPSSIALATMLSFGLARAHAAEPSKPEQPASAKPLESRQQNIGPITCAIPKPAPKPSATPSGPSKYGFVYGKEGGHLREKPSSSAKPLGMISPGFRLAYTDVIYDKTGKAQWYYIPQRYGKPEGWISADDVLTWRSTLPPVQRAWDLKASDLSGKVEVSASMTCSFRG